MKRLSPFYYLFFFALTLQPWSAVASEEQPNIPVTELRLFAEIFEHIKSAYVEPVSDQELLENAIRGMLSGLDPHSDYLDPEAFGKLRESTSGSFGGVGLEVGINDGVLRVISPIDDTPAYTAGILAGDIISQIDNESTQGISIGDAIKKMRGNIGTAITLTIIREGVDTPLDFNLIRAGISSRSVRQRLLESHYGYVRISQFQSNTPAQLSRSIRELLKMGELKGLILDLRNNPGGVLQASIEVADLFLSEGSIVSTKGRLPDSEQAYASTPDVIIPTSTPIIILMNAGSASASEIVAGALQDNRRAIIMGVDSYGKGSVQSILPVGGDRGIKLTTSLYFTPSGKSIQTVGIVPDIRTETLLSDVDNSRDKPLDDALNLLKALHVLQGDLQ